jgi:hypothetical protein
MAPERLAAGERQPTGDVAGTASRDASPRPNSAATGVTWVPRRRRSGSDATRGIASTAWPGHAECPPPELLGILIDRAEDEELFASHATAYETLKSERPDLLREIAAEDGAWERSDLAASIDDE